LVQHDLVLALADILPCRVLGDPLQGIFSFAGPCVDWPSHVDPSFERLDPLSTPWRWTATNAVLGEWLLSIRHDLEHGRAISIADAPVIRGDIRPAIQVASCMSRLRAGGSVVAIRKWPDHAHEIARKLGGQFTSMEEMDCKDLVTFARELERARGCARATMVIDFGTLTMTEVGTRLATLRARLASGSAPERSRSPALVSVYEAVAAIADCDDAALGRTASAALHEMANLPGTKVFRRELLSELDSASRLVEEGGAESLSEAVWYVRERTRHLGRRLDARVVSRPLLIKGLEFDHAVVLEPSELTAKELYVSLTRGAKSLTVLTPSSTSTVSYRGAST
jgi:hypothetical protein